MNQRNKFIARVIIRAAALFVIALMASVWYVWAEGNFHIITMGEAYRSAQLDDDNLSYYVNKYQIKSILNLRGKYPNEVWYKDELNISSKYKVSHYDVELSAYSEPRKEDIRDIMDIFLHAPRPLLIHCRAGADRSGLVAAMWKLVVDKQPKAEAEKQLSIFFGHLSIGSASAMDDFFQKWTPAFNPEVMTSVQAGA